MTTAKKAPAKRPARNGSQPTKPVVDVNDPDTLLDELSFDEREQLDALLGFPDVQPGVQTLVKIMAYIIVRRTEPDLTLEEFGRRKPAEVKLGNG